MTVSVASAAIAGISVLVTGSVAIATVRHNKRTRDNAAEQLRLTRAAQLRSDRPRFTFETEVVRDDHLVVVGTMVDGPTGIAVALAWWSTSYLPIEDGVRQEKQGHHDEEGTYQVFLDDDLKFGVPIPSDADHGEIRVSMQCRELDGDEREWPVNQVAKWVRPPAPFAFYG